MGFAVNTVKVCALVFFSILAFIGFWGVIATAVNHESIPKRQLIAGCVIFILVILFAIAGIFAVLRKSMGLSIFCAVVFLVVAITNIAIVTYMMDHPRSSSSYDLQSEESRRYFAVISSMIIIFEIVGGLLSVFLAIIFRK